MHQCLFHSGSAPHALEALFARDVGHLDKAVNATTLQLPVNCGYFLFPPKNLHLHIFKRAWQADVWLCHMHSCGPYKLVIVQYRCGDTLSHGFNELVWLALHNRLDAPANSRTQSCSEPLTENTTTVELGASNAGNVDQGSNLYVFA